MIRPKSLQQRLSLFMILPVALLLVLMGIIGFVYARDLWLAQWQEAAILKLQRSAHQVDMLLSRIKVRVEGLDNAADSEAPREVFDWTVERVAQVPGVERVALNWPKATTQRSAMAGESSPMQRHRAGMQQMMGGQGHLRMMRFKHAQPREITPPRYDSKTDHQTMSMIFDLLDEKGKRLGNLEVIVRFDFLMENIVETGWWQSNEAFLVETNGNILVCTLPGDRKTLGETNDPLERQTLKALQTQTSGTIMGGGHPPHEVSGFYRLSEAPWAVVMIAPGTKILSAIVTFRTYYFIVVTGFIAFILLLIRFVSGKTVAQIKSVSRAADRVAKGDYDTALPVKTRDEVGRLIGSFNQMAAQLRERMRLKEAMGLAQEVQQNLLPAGSVKMDGLEIAGRSIYCEETGGDYFDFLPVEDGTGSRIAVAVGDVVGHGISSALLMTTGRAMLRCRISQPGDLSEVVCAVNRLLCQDTAESGSFMTLFCGMLDMSSRQLRWVRAGHDPALLFDPQSGMLTELQGKGAALGVDRHCAYEENKVENLTAGQILFIGTDGVWETRNEGGRMFGKQRAEELLRRYAELDAAAIVDAVISELNAFRGTARQEDDITLIVAKVVP